MPQKKSPARKRQPKRINPKIVFVQRPIPKPKHKEYVPPKEMLKLIDSRLWGGQQTKNHLGFV